MPLFCMPEAEFSGLLASEFDAHIFMLSKERLHLWNIHVKQLELAYKNCFTPSAVRP